MATAGPTAGQGRVVMALALAGACVLMIGALVYLTDRHASASRGLVAAFAVGAPTLFGSVGGWLPSFVHPFAFSLFSAATQPADAATAHRGCAFWWAVNAGFEWAQHPAVNVAVAQAIEDVLGRNAITRSLADYVLLGSFDVRDLVAVTAGALAAAQVLAIVRRRGSM